VSDAVSRLCEDGSMKAGSFWKPVVIDMLSQTGAVGPFMCTAIASWIRYSLAIDEQGEHIQVKDPAAGETLKIAAQNVIDIKNAYAFINTAFGDEIGCNNPFFSTCVYEVFDNIRQNGTHSVLKFDDGACDEAYESPISSCIDLSLAVSSH